VAARPRVADGPQRDEQAAVERGSAAAMGGKKTSPEGLERSSFVLDEQRSEGQPLQSGQCSGAPARGFGGNPSPGCGAVAVPPSMTSPELPAEVRRFVLTSIPSVPYLEAVLLLRANPEQAWDAGHLARRLYVPERTGAELIALLKASGIAAPAERPAPSATLPPRNSPPCWTGWRGPMPPTS
jgi:hypothetical protein